MTILNLDLFFVLHLMFHMCYFSKVYCILVVWGFSHLLFFKFRCIGLLDALAMSRGKFLEVIIEAIFVLT